MSTERFRQSEEVESNIFRRDITYDESQQQYTEWADYYDATLDDKPKVYSVLVMYEQGVEKLFSDKSQRRCLDLGAGTGLTGERLRKVGYSDFDGVEPNEKMADALKKKGIYKNITVAPIGGDKPLDIPDNSYDLIACGGSFAAGHIPCSAIPEIVRLLKPGQIIVAYLLLSMVVISSIACVKSSSTMFRSTRTGLSLSSMSLRRKGKSRTSNGLFIPIIM
ncbi:Williams-Beuren syndrome chromosomal region 27 protein-like [Elysia marginata]|uniref:Williams-Beuren syndrome chromosomal region 27 protein-like n=1 Tax=Elysia marginata TaxID=1093978 RepID=A0AAV4GYZ9_9GAST|nr:Williams-Beuren syndrome chromosomal region 27 protein-like [Elysia marginata]